MGLRRLRCAGPCACGAALVVLVVPSLRFILASQAGLVTGWRIAAMPPNILTGGAAARGSGTRASWYPRGSSQRAKRRSQEQGTGMRQLGRSKQVLRGFAPLLP